MKLKLHVSWPYIYSSLEILFVLMQSLTYINVIISRKCLTCHFWHPTEDSDSDEEIGRRRKKRIQQDSDKEEGGTDLFDDEGGSPAKSPTKDSDSDEDGKAGEFISSESWRAASITS